MPLCCKCSKEVGEGDYVEIAERAGGRGFARTRIQVYCNGCALQRRAVIQTAVYVFLVAFAALVVVTLLRFL